MLVQACGLYPLVGQLDRTDRSGGGRGRRGLTIKTRKAEVVSTAPSSALGNATADVRFGPFGAPTHLVAYEEVTRGAHPPPAIYAPQALRRRRVCPFITIAA